MPETLRGISEPDDIQSQEDALRLLGIDETATEDEIDEAVDDLFFEAHPDGDGTTELFQAVQLAQSALKGDTLISPSGGGTGEMATDAMDISIVGASPSSADTTVDTQEPDADTDFGDFGGAGGSGGDTRTTANDFGGFGSDEGFGGESVGFRGGPGVDPEVIVEEVKDILRENADIEAIKEQYGEIANFDNVAEIIATQVLQGNLTLGDVERMVGEGERVGSTESATGGLFSDNPGGNLFGGSSPFFADDPSDARYSPGDVEFDPDNPDNYVDDEPDDS